MSVCVCVRVSVCGVRLCAAGHRQNTAGSNFSLLLSPTSLSLSYLFHLQSLRHTVPPLTVYFSVSSHLHTQLFPLTVELLQLLLQQSRVTGRDILGQVRLHVGQFLQSDGQMLQRELSLLHNTHKHAHLSTRSDSHVQVVCEHASLFSL